MNISCNSYIIPKSILISSSKILFFLGRIFNTSFYGIHPERIKKLIFSTNISGKKLIDNGFKIDYSLERALSDWKNENDKNFK